MIKLNNMKSLLKNKLFYAVLGALGGFLYWKFVGCTTGSCPMQQSWFLSTLWGATFGWLGSGLFLGCGCYGGSCEVPDKSESKNKSKEEEK